MTLILYVDDEPALLELGKRYLERSRNFTVDTAVSAAEAITKLQSRSYDGIISDYQMPEMDGIAFLKYVRAHYEYLPFILFTGRGREEVVIDALNNGADFYVQKGGDPTSQFAELEHKVTVAVVKTRTECQLEESQQRMEDMVNFLPDAIFAIDCQGTVIIWNRSMEELTGIKRQDILGKGNYEYAIPFYGERSPVLIDLVLKEDKETEKKYPRIVKRDDTLISENFIPVLKEGEGAYVSFTAAPLYDRKGHAAGAIESIRDITELRWMESELRNSEEQYRTLFDNTGTATVLIEENTVICLANREFERLSGYPKEEIEGKMRWTEFVVKDDLERMLAQHRLRRERKEAALKHYEFRVVTKSGEIRTIFLSIDMIPGTKRSVASLMDITERKRAEEALTKSQIQLAEAMDLANLVNWEFDVASGIFTFNDRFYALYGTTAEREGGYQMPAEVYAREFVHPDEVSVVADEVQNAITATDPNYTTHIEHRIICRDGEIRHITVQFGITKDADGRTVKTHGANQDITERKRAEEELLRKNTELHAAYEQLAATEEELWQNYDELSQKEQALCESEEKYRTIFKNAGDAIAIHDLEGHFVEVNDVICRRFGYTRDEMLQMNVGDVNVPDHARNVGEKIHELTKKGHIIFETVHIARDGRQIPAEVSAVLFHLGKKPLVMSIARDITERKQAEEQLRQFAEELDQIFQTAADGMRVVDRDFNVLRMNGTFLKLAGIRREDASGRKCYEVFPGPRCHTPGCPLTRILSGEAQVSDEIEKERRDGSRVPCIVTATPFRHPDGELIGIVEDFKDITERKRAEEILQESEERYRDLFENAKDLIQMVAPDGRILYVNPAWRETLGYSEKEIAGLSAFDIIHPDKVEHSREVFRRVMSGEDVGVIETTLVSKDGREIIVERSCTSKFVNGESVYCRCISHDITKQKRAEEMLIKKHEDLEAACEEITATEEELRQNYDELSKKEHELRESERKYRDLVELLPQTVFELDERGIIISANHIALKSFGYTQEDLDRGLNGFDVIAPGDRDRARKNMQRALNGELLGGIEYTAMRKDGSTFPVIIYANAILHQNTPVGVRGVLVDITELKHAEEELQKKQREMAAVLKGLRGVVVEYLDPSLTILWANEEMAKEFGISPGEVRGEHCYEVIQNRKERCPDCPACMSAKVRDIADREVTLPDGRVFLVRCNPVMDEKGSVAGVVHAMINITERKQMEDSLALASKNLNLLSGITRHDILNQVMVILGYVALAREEAGDPAMEESLREIESATKTIRSQIEFTRVYQDIGSHEPQWQEIDEIIPRADVPGGITLDADLSGILVYADPMLPKVFFNLLDNTVKHGERVTRITVSQDQRENGMVIVWEDDGAGVVTSEKNRIFECDVGKNTGLGLFLIREILLITGITITETGEPGKGARFEITVPKGAYRFGGAR